MKTALFSLLAVGLAACASATPEAGPPVPAPALEAVGEKLKTGAYGNTHALLAFKAGKPVAEFYASGEDQTIGRRLGVVTFGASTLHDIRSISKSVVGLAFGVAYSEGKIGNLDAPVLDFFPEYADLQTPERRKITLRHMLTMTSGLAWDENTYPYTDPRNSEIAMGMAPDQFRYVLSQAIAQPAGTKFQYSGGDVAVLAEVLHRKVGTQVDAYADRVLFGPLGVKAFEWNGDRNDVPYAASGLRLRPRDLAKIGLLVSAKGKWNGKQVVPAEWIAASTTPHAQVSGGAECGVSYGYLWWLGTTCNGPLKTTWIAGFGNGGQRLWIVPASGTIIVSLAGHYDQLPQGPMSNAVFRDALIAASIP